MATMSMLDTMDLKSSQLRLSVMFDQETILTDPRKRIYRCQVLLSAVLFVGVIGGAVKFCEYLREHNLDTMKNLAGTSGGAPGTALSGPAAALAESTGRHQQLQEKSADILLTAQAEQQLRWAQNQQGPCRTKVAQVDKQYLFVVNSALPLLARVRDDCDDTVMGNFETSFFFFLSPEQFQFMQVVVLTISCML